MKMDFVSLPLRTRKFDSLKTSYSVADECDLTLLGYIAFLDPPKDSAREAIAALAAKGYRSRS